jgi:hypothetical protein
MFSPGGDDDDDCDGKLVSWLSGYRLFSGSGHVFQPKLCLGLSKANESPSLTLPTGRSMFFPLKNGQRSVPGRCPVRVWASRHEKEL